MTPFDIGWIFDMQPLANGEGEGRPALDPFRLAAIREVIFEKGAGRRWARVLRGWPTAADGSPPLQEDATPLREFQMKVEFAKFGGRDEVVGRVPAASVRHTRAANGLPRFPCGATMQIDLDDFDLLMKNPARFIDTVTHELGHALGLGMLYLDRGLVREHDRRCFFTGENARRAYGELRAPGDQAPELLLAREEHKDGSISFHWDESLLGRDLMSPDLDPAAQLDGSTFEGNVISKVSVGALADLGYLVDPQGAERYPTAA